MALIEPRHPTDYDHFHPKVNVPAVKLEPPLPVLVRRDGQWLPGELRYWQRAYGEWLGDVRVDGDPDTWQEIPAANLRPAPFADQIEVTRTQGWLYREPRVLPYDEWKRKYGNQGRRRSP